MAGKPKGPRNTLHIKNMVCDRCIQVVEEELGKLHIPVFDIKLGEVITDGPLSKEQTNQIRAALENRGFVLLEDKAGQLIEKIKTMVITTVRRSPQKAKTNFSRQLQQEIGKDYNYLSTLFSSVENVTIERYTILQKIEYAKELLIYNELTLGEIAFQLGYSSVQHLSGQFRKTTGMSPSQFKKLREKTRKPLDKLNT